MVERPSVQWIGSPNYRPQSGIPPLFYVVHWMVGNLAGTDSAFPNASYGVATNYGIENGVIHQYVRDGDYAYGTGNTYANSRGISVEHAGGWALPGGGRFTPTDATHESSARLLAWLSQTYGWGELRVGVNVFEHRDFVATECPGTTRTAAIAARANQILAGGGGTGEDDMIRMYQINATGTTEPGFQPGRIWAGGPEVGFMLLGTRADTAPGFPSGSAIYKSLGWAGVPAYIPAEVNQVKAMIRDFGEVTSLRSSTASIDVDEEALAKALAPYVKGVTKAEMDVALVGAVNAIRSAIPTKFSAAA